VSSGRFQAQLTFEYPTDLSFPDGWAQNAEKVWRSLPNVLSYEGSVADRVVGDDLIKKALTRLRG